MGSDRLATGYTSRPCAICGHPLGLASFLVEGVRGPICSGCLQKRNAAKAEEHVGGLRGAVRSFLGIFKR